MSKIIKKPDFEEVTCRACGCVYEYEEGDDVLTLSHIASSTSIYNKSETLVRMRVRCPICGHDNELKIKT